MLKRTILDGDFIRNTRKMRKLLSVITSILLVVSMFTACVDSTTSSKYTCLPDKAVYEITKEIDFIDGKSLPHSHKLFFIKTRKI